MRNLLSANFLRLWRSKPFWGSMAVSFGMAVFLVLEDFRSAQQDGYATSLDAELFKYAAFIGIIAGALIPLFFGTEYSDGAIRNKLIVGQSRTGIYFANLITSFAACGLCSAAYLLGCVGFGIPLLGWFTQSPALLLTALVGTLLMTAAFCAIFTFVVMNRSSRSASAVMCLMGVFAAFIGALVLYSRLEAPEFIEGYTLSIGGEIVSAPTQPNPNYLTGAKRELYRFIFDLLPTGQSVQYCSLLFPDPARLMGLALAVTALFTGAGLALFRKKDLK